MNRRSSGLVAIATLVLVACHKDSESDPPCMSDAAPGIHICCGQPGELVGSNCVAWSFIQDKVDHCVAESGELDGHDIPYGAHCCEGLQVLDDLVSIDDPDAASLQDPPRGCTYASLSGKICTRCGNHICDRHENRCNCPSDCN